MNRNTLFDVVVIGAGASATAFITSFYTLHKSSKTPIKIAVVDKKENVGCGEIYKEDFSWLLMNTPTENLSAQIGCHNDFERWAKKNAPTNYKNARFVPRHLFGSYLKNKFLFVQKKAAKNNLLIMLIDDAVQKVDADANAYYATLHLTSGGKITAKFVVFATGPGVPIDAYQLQGAQNYLHQPFPACVKLQLIPKEAKVGILGTSLTAIDVAISLKHLNHQGKIVMLSKHGRLPQVKGFDLDPIPPGNVSFENYKKMAIKNGGYLNLKLLLKPIRKHLILHGHDWRSCFFNKELQPDNSCVLGKKIQDAEKGKTLFNLILGLIPEVNKAWRLILKDQLDYFMKYFFKGVNQKHGAMPLVNAKKIQSLLVSRQLEIKSGVQAIKQAGDKFEIKLSNDITERYDFIVNASGLARMVCGKIIKIPYLDLCHNNKISELTTGGIFVDTPSGRIMNKNGKFDTRLRAIGHVAEGSHPFTNNFDWIVYSGYEVAQAILNEIFN